MRTKKKPAASYSPPPPPREHHKPREEWAPPTVPRLSMWSGVNPSPTSLHRLLCSTTYHLPPWQRGQVWTPAQQVALCETIWNGLPMAPFLLWERQTGPGVEDRGVVVLDGQQRLCALGADVRRHDGTPCAPTAARLDLETGRWGVNAGSDDTPITMRHLASTAWLSERVFDQGFRHDERLMDLVCAAEMRVQHWTGVVYVMGLGFTPELATAVFRSWNIPGEPIPASEIEALIREADLGWSP